MPPASDHVPVVERLRAVLPGWAGGVLTGVQGVVLSYLVVLGPAFAAVAGAPSLDGSATVDWSGAAGVATRVWLLGLSVPIPITGGLVSLVPLGLPLLMIAILVAVARRFAVKTWTSWILAVTTFAAGAGLIAYLAPHGPSAAAPHVIQATMMAALIAAPSVAYGVFRQYGARLRILDRVPDEWRAGLRLGAVTLLLVIVAASLAGALWTFAGREEVAVTASALGMDPLGGIALAVGETFYIPTIVCWMVSYLVGPGFMVGEGTLYSASAVSMGSLPGVPLLQVLPSEAGGWWVWGPFLLAALGFVARLMFARRIPVDWLSARTAGIGLATVLVGVWGMGVVSHGAIGAGRLAQVGFEPLPVAALATALVAAGYAVAWALQGVWVWLRDRGRASAVKDKRRNDARPRPARTTDGQAATMTTQVPASTTAE